MQKDGKRVGKKMAESGSADENVTKKSVPDREERLRALRERQAEERLRRLEELKKQALETQQLREQKEAERRKRMEELRLKENERRSQVEGRKKMIFEAEQERREAILRKNQEREARLDHKRRNEKSSIVFAFGSSTPRLLETYDSMFASYWGPRRATSTANLRLYPAVGNLNSEENGTPRRSIEREQDSKKRAASAGGLYRMPAGKMSTSMYEVLHWCSEPDPYKFPPYSLNGSVSADVEDGSNTTRVGRRKTDLMPTTPSPRDPTSRPGSGSRSLSRTPGRAVSMARLDQLARPRQQLSRSTVQLADPSPLRASKSMVALGRAQPIAPPRTTRAERLRQRARAIAAARSPNSESALSSGDVTPSRPGSVMSQSSILSSSTLNPRLRSAPKRPRPSSIHVTGLSKEKILSPSEDPKIKEDKNIKPPTPAKPALVKKLNQQKNEEIKKFQRIKSELKGNSVVTEEKSAKKAPEKTKKKELAKVNVKEEVEKAQESKGEDPKNEAENDKNLIPEVQDTSTPEESITAPEKSNELSVKDVSQQNGLLVDLSEETDTQVLPPESKLTPVSNELVTLVTPATIVEENTQVEKNSVEQSTSPEGDATDGSNKGNPMTRSRITTEEEAKAILAERRRLAREQAEREAEAERQRLEREAAEEAERLRREEEEQRLAEEEQLRMIEEARKLEEKRLMLAIQEAQKREEEEKERKRLEEQARIEKEEADRLAREEAEKQRLEMAERLKKEEEERQARRKRVEAIMKRTRNAAPSNSKPDGEKGEQDGAEHEKDEPRGAIEAFLHGERLSADRSLSNGQGSQMPQITNRNDESHSNGLSLSGKTNEDCVNSNPSLATPLIAFQGKTNNAPMSTDFLA